MSWLVLPMLLAAAPAGAQVVSGVVEEVAGGSVPHASVTVTDAQGDVVASTFADRGGRFTLHLPAGGWYRLRVVEDQFMPASVSFRVEDNGTHTRRVRLHLRSAGANARRMQGADRGERSGGTGGGRGAGPRTPAGSDN
jgi:hypothetical protein